MQNSTSFTDLAPTEADAAGVVGGAAFLDIGPLVTTIAGIMVTVSGQID